MINHVSAFSCTSGIPGDFPYKRLVKAMIGHAILDSKKKYADFRWLMESELAELYCEVVGEDINKVRETAKKIRSSNRHWQNINKRVDYLAVLDNGRLKIDDATALEIRDIFDNMHFSKTTLAKLYNVSVATIREVLKREVE